MTLTFTWDIDYDKLNNMMDEFLKSHYKELTDMVGKCLVVKTGETVPIITTRLPEEKIIQPIQQQQQHGLQAATTTVVADHKVDNRPLIGDDIPEDPFSNMFPNPNAGAETRYKDRNNLYNKKGFDHRT